MVFSYEHKVIIQYLRRKYQYGARKIVADHPEFDWNENGVKTLIKKIEDGSHRGKPGDGGGNYPQSGGSAWHAPNTC